MANIEEKSVVLANTDSSSEKIIEGQKVSLNQDEQVLDKAMEDLASSGETENFFGNNEGETPDLSAWATVGMDTEFVDVTEEETAAGEEEEATGEGEGSLGSFAARDGSLVDVNSDLRARTFARTTTFKEVEKGEELDELNSRELGQSTNTTPINNISTPTNPVNPNLPETGTNTPTTPVTPPVTPTPVEPTPTIPTPTEPIPTIPPVTPPTPETVKGKITLTGSEVVEGNKIKISATVDKAPKTDLSIELSNKEIITIKAGQTAGEVEYDSRIDDTYKQANDIENISISNTTGGNYDELDTSSTTTTTVKDDSDVTTITLKGSEVEEGNKITITASVDNPVTKEDLVITLDNGKTITIKVGETTGKVEYDSRADDLYTQGTTTDTIKITGTTGGNYEVLDKTSTTIVKVSDDSDVVKIQLLDNATTKEGGDLIHHLKLVDENGNVVNIKAGEEVNITLKYISTDDIDSYDFQNGKNQYSADEFTITLTSSTPRDENGNYIIKNTTKSDGDVEGTEKYSLEIKNVSQKNGTFEKIEVDSSKKSVTGTIEEGLYLKNIDHNVTIYKEQVQVEDGSAPKPVTTNLVLTLDVSYSMVDNDGNQGVTNKDIDRLKIAKESLIELIEEYKDQGATKVNLTLFAKDSKNIGWMSADDAIKYIESLKIPTSNKVTSDYKITTDSNGNVVSLTKANGTDTGVNSGGTNYEAAIDKTTAIDFTEHQADRTLAFFISDGEPTIEYTNNTKNINSTAQNTAGTYFNSIDSITDNTIDGQKYGRVDKEYYDKWTDFVNSNTIGVTTVIGLGKLSTQGEAYLNMMAKAYSGEAVFVADNKDEFMAALVKDGKASGTIFDKVENEEGNLTIESITFDGNTYTKAQYNTAVQGYGKLFSDDGKYTLSFDFTTGKYNFVANANEFKGQDKPYFEVTVKDSASNETVTGKIEFNVTSSDGEYNLGYAEIDGGAGYDVIKLSLGQDIDFSELGTVIKNIEEIDLSAEGENKLLNLSLKDVLNMTDKDNTLKITGTSEDVVKFKADDGWQLKTENIGKVEGDKTFDIYTNTKDTTVYVKIEQPITDGITH